jgi:hypothetical protein
MLGIMLPRHSEEKKDDDELELRRPRDEDPRLAERRRPETTNATSSLAV